MQANNNEDGRTEFQKILNDLKILIANDRTAIQRWSYVKDEFVTGADRLVVDSLLSRLDFHGAVNETLERWAGTTTANVSTTANFVRILRKHFLIAFAEQICVRFPNAVTNSVPILQLAGQSNVHISVQILKDILVQVGNRPVAIYSINGKARGGKSFMLNLFLKYLQFGRTHPNNWIDQILPKIFMWQGGEDRVTTGIQVWSEIFTVEPVGGGTEAAIILLDAQGLFDERTEMQGNALIFAFSMLLSSVNIFNVKDVGEDTLQYLHTFIEFAKIAVPENTEGNVESISIFQKLILLLRDYSNTREYGLGLHDSESCPMNRQGQHMNLLSRYFDAGEEFNKMSSQAQLTRRNIRDCFKELSVVTLPFPGTSLTTDDNDNTSAWDPMFREHATKFVEDLFSPAAVHASTKRIGGVETTGLKMLDFIDVWASLYSNSSQIPELKSVLEATAEVQGRQNMQTALEIYKNGMDQLLRDNSDGMNQETLGQHHRTLRESSLENFMATRGIGGQLFQQSFVQLLETEIDEAHSRYVELNNDRVAAFVKLTDAKQFAIQTAQINVDESRRSLEGARTRLTAIHQNVEPYYDHSTIRVKHRTSFLGFNANPYYTTEAVKTFNQGRFEAAVAAAQEEIRNEEAKVERAISKLQEAQNQD